MTVLVLLAPSDYYVLLEVFIFLAVAQVVRSLTKKTGFPRRSLPTSLRGC